jgi:hypothetical protein
MSYNIVKSDGTPLTVVADGQTNNITTSLTLIGKNYAGYGTFLNENFVKLLENFSNRSAPLYPLVGQLWWKSDTRVLQVYDTYGTWKSISGAQSLADQPTNAVAGDLWFDSVNQQLKVYSGAAWVIIGPSFTTTTGTSGAVADTIIDTTLFPHVVVKFYVQNRLVAILSKDSAFTPQTTLPGFATVKPGFNLNSDNVPSLLYYENANNSAYLGGVPANQFLTKTNAVLNNQLVIQTPDGLAIQELGGTVTDFTITVAGQNVNLFSRVRGNGLVIQSKPDNAAGATVNVLTVDKSSGLITVLADPQTGLGVATKNYVDNLASTLQTYLASNVNTLNTSIGTIVANVLTTTGSYTAMYGNVRLLQSQLGFNNPTLLAIAQGGYTANAYARFTTNDTFAGNLLTLWANVSAIHANVLSNLGQPGAGAVPGPAGSMFSNVYALQGEVSNHTANKLNRDGSLDLTGTLKPSTDNQYELGTPLRTFANIYSGAVTVTSLPHFGANLSGDIGQSTSRFGVIYASGAQLTTLTVGGTATFVSAPLPAGNAAVNLGSSGAWWNNIYGVSIQARYADLAERYASDIDYAPGTLVRIGGSAEITQENDDASENVFGVISTNPGHVLNAGSDGLPVALAGRVPVRVVGPVERNGRLVSAGNGVARAAKPGEATAFNVIGRTLQEKVTSGEELVEAAVTIR